jgi:hypothetical protein
LTQHFQCDLQSLQGKYVDQGCKHAHEAAITTMQMRPRTSRRRAAPVAPTMFPTSMPGATLSEKTQGFMRFLQSKHHLTKPWKQQFQCKMEAWINKHNGTAHAIFQRSPPRSADNGDHFCAIRAHPERARRMDEVPCIDAGSHFVQENTEFHVISRIQTSLDKTLEAAIPMQNASLDHQTQWHRACNLSKITSAQR